MHPVCSFAGFPDDVVATAIHAGHELRPDIRALTALDDATRLREEDPFTDLLTGIGGATVVAHRSRFEVDLNRPPAQAVEMYNPAVQGRSDGGVFVVRRRAPQ